jgi:hypothetical protein
MKEKILSKNPNLEYEVKVSVDHFEELSIRLL